MKNQFNILLGIIAIVSLLVISTSTYGQMATTVYKSKVGVYLKYVSVDEAGAKFYADLYWWINIKADTSLVKRDSLAAFTYYDSVVSQLEFMNALDVSQNQVQEKKWVWRDGVRYFYKTGNLKSTFNFTPDFRRYPIDNQVLPIMIESPVLYEDQLELEPDFVKESDHQMVDKSVEVKGYKINQISATTISSDYNTDFGDKNNALKHYSRIVYNIELDRAYLSFFLKIFIPNFLLLAIAYLVFFIPAKELEVAVGCTVTSLLASIALKLNIDDNLPSVGYTTYSDELFYLFYFMITGALVQTVFSYNLHKKGNHILEKRLEILGRIAYPIILLVGLFLILR